MGALGGASPYSDLGVHQVGADGFADVAVKVGVGSRFLRVSGRSDDRCDVVQFVLEKVDVHLGWWVGRGGIVQCRFGGKVRHRVANRWHVTCARVGKDMVEGSGGIVFMLAGMDGVDNGK